MENLRNPDIQRLLANLRNGSYQSDTNHNVQHQSSSSSSNDQAEQLKAGSAYIPGLGLTPEKSVSSSIVPQSESDTAQLTTRPAQPSTPHERAATPTVPDASSITTWPAALKYVSKYTVPNEKAASKIRHLIGEQHKHERQWWAGREAIMARHSGRAGNQTKVADLLKSLGGATVPVAQHDPKLDEAELAAYDQKVHRSLMEMTADFDRQLRMLQIPFFAIKHDLVITEDGLHEEGHLKGRLDKGELRELQGKMIETLEDLFGEE